MEEVSQSVRHRRQTETETDKAQFFCPAVSPQKQSFGRGGGGVLDAAVVEVSCPGTAPRPVRGITATRGCADRLQQLSERPIRLTSHKLYSLCFMFISSFSFIHSLVIPVFLHP